MNLKGFKTATGTVEGLLRFDEQFHLILEPKKSVKPNKPEPLACPKCKKGTVIKGKTAYGCSEYITGCDFRYSFDDLRKKLENHKPTKELVYKILNEK